MRKLVVLLLCLFVSTLSVIAQSAGDYRSAGTGDWSNNSTWETYNGLAWVAAGSTPTSANGAITILNTHTVTVTASVSADQLTVESTGQITVNSGQDFTVNNGAGTDLTIEGTVSVVGKMIMSNISTVLVNGTLTYDGEVELNTNSNLTVSGTLQLNTGGFITFAAVSGNINVAPTGTFVHNGNGGTIPDANWQIGSTCEVTGYTSSTSAPSGLGQAFHNFNWNCTSQTSTIDLNAGLTSVDGDFTITSTGSGSLSLASSGSYTLTVGDEFIIQNGTLIITSGSTAATVNVSGDYTQNGGFLDMSGSGATASGTMNISGNFDLNAGTITENSSSAGGNIGLKGGSLQSITANGFIVNNINFTLNNVNGAELNTHFTMPSNTTLTLQSGQLDLNGRLLNMSADALLVRYTAGTLSAAATWLGAGSAGANIEYAGTTACTTDVELPSSAAKININNTGGVVLNKTLSITATLTLTQGTFELNSNTLTVGASGEVIRNSSGSVSAAISGTWGILTYQGTSSITPGPELKASLATLNINNTSGITLTQAVNISSELSFSLSVADNHLRLDNFNLTLDNSAVITNASSSRFVLQTGTGVLRKRFSSASTFEFPIGENTSSTDYSPAILTFNSGTFTSGIVSLQVVDAKHPNNSSAVDFLSRYWVFSVGGITSYSADVEFYYVKGDVNGTEGNMYTAQYNGSNWSLLNQTNTTNNFLSGTTNLLNEFTGGEIAVLPVELINFNGVWEDNRIKLSWSTATEINNDYFEIQRSFNGTDFNSIGTLPGHGNSLIQHDYFFYDEDISSKHPIYYYRLKQVDFNGNLTYSQIMNVQNRPAEKLLSDVTFSNPFRNALKVRYNLTHDSPISITISDMRGNTIEEKRLLGNRGENTIRLLDGINQHKPGLYIMEIAAGEHISRYRIVKN